MPVAVSFESFLEEWLRDVLAGDPNALELGRRFGQKLITQWLDQQSDSDDIVYCDGTGDGGIDIAILDRGETDDDESSTGRTWYLVQSKYGSGFRGSGHAPRRGTQSHRPATSMIARRGRLSSLAEGLLEKLRVFKRQSSERDRIILVFATELPLSEEQQQTLGDLRAMGRERLGPLFDVEHLSVQTVYRRMLDDIESDATKRTRVALCAKIAAPGQDLLVGTVSITELYVFLKSYRETTGDLDKIYEKNVRRFLGSRGRVNKAIIATLKSQPERFGLYNNGITIVVADFSPSEENRGEGIGSDDGGARDDKTFLIDPYIVNGCQTTRSLWEVCHQRFEAGGTGEDPHLED